MNDKITVTDYFGGCPKCGGSDSLYNVGRANWFVCHTHKVRWTVDRTFSQAGAMKLKTNSARGGEWSQTTKTLRTALCRRAFGRETPSLTTRSWKSTVAACGLRLPRRPHATVLELKIATERLRPSS